MSIIKDVLPIDKVGRVGIRIIKGKYGIRYQFRVVVPAELRHDGKREKTMVWVNEQQLKGKALRIKLEQEAMKFEHSILENNVNNNMLLSDYIQHFKKAKATKNKNHNTQLYYDNMAQRVNQYFKNTKITDVTVAKANDFFIWLAEQKSAIPQTAKQNGNLKEFTRLFGATQREIAEKSKVSIKTVEACFAGDNINIDKARKIFAAIQEIVSDKNHIRDINRIRANRRPAEMPLEIPNVSFGTFFSINSVPYLSSKTIREHYVFLHAVLQLAVKEKIITDNPLDDIEKPEADTKELEYFDKDEIKTIIGKINEEVKEGRTSYKWKAFLYLLIFSGARRGEITGLTWDSINFDTGVMAITQATSYSHQKKQVYIHTTKTKQSVRSISLNAEVLKVLKEYRREYEVAKAKAAKWVDTGLIFVQQDGRPISPGAIDDWMVEFSKRNKLPHMHPHKFRHSAATNMLQSNQIDLKSTSVMLGHSKPSVTSNIYAHALRDTNTRAYNVLTDVYNAEEEK